jgi:hypothetical protein
MPRPYASLPRQRHRRHRAVPQARRNQLRIATFVSIEPDDVRQLIKAIDYTIEHMRG